MSADAATPSAANPTLVANRAGRSCAPGLLLRVDTRRWRTHLERVLTAYGVGLVPVCKGNGYGLGVSRLAEEAARLNVSAVAVGTEWELGDVLPRFPGEVLVLTPWHGATGGSPTTAAPEPRVLRTVAHLATVRQLLTCLLYTSPSPRDRS